MKENRDLGKCTKEIILRELQIKRVFFQTASNICSLYKAKRSLRFCNWWQMLPKPYTFEPILKFYLLPRICTNESKLIQVFQTPKKCFKMIRTFFKNILSSFPYAVLKEMTFLFLFFGAEHFTHSYLYCTQQCLSQHSSSALLY